MRNPPREDFLTAALVYNHGAGQWRGDDSGWLEQARAHLRGRGVRLEVTASESAESATRIARRMAEEGIGLVIAAGGDGTLRAVADGLAGTHTALGILPRGTVNVLAREFGIPQGDLAAACDVCLDGGTRRIDLGRIGTNHFLLMCSVGFDAASVGNVNRDIKGIVGSPAYLLSGLATLATYNPTEITLTLDGETHRYAAFMVVVANAPTYGGDFTIAPLASQADGQLDVCVFEAPPGPPPLQKANFLRQVGAVALNRQLVDPDLHFFRARRIEVISEPRAAVQIDGDTLGLTPIAIEVLPGALSVRVPRPESEI